MLQDLCRPDALPAMQPNTVRSLNESQSTDPNQDDHSLVLSAARRLREEALLPVCSLSTAISTDAGALVVN